MEKINTLYYCQHNGSLSLIRFYEDLTVITASTLASLEKIPLVLTWFKPSHKNVYHGDYSISNGNSISIKYKMDFGINEYKGTINGNKYFINYTSTGT